jgi:hypothetical protein
MWSWTLPLNGARLGRRTPPPPARRCAGGRRGGRSEAVAARLDLRVLPVYNLVVLREYKTLKSTILEMPKHFFHVCYSSFPSGS